MSTEDDAMQNTLTLAPPYTSDTSSEPKYVQLVGRMRYTRWFIIALAPVILVTSSWWPEHSLMHELMEWGGHILVVIGVMIRIFASLYVGGRKNNELVTDGPFSIVRNPLYVGSFLAMTGLGLLTGSLLITLLLVIAFIFCYAITVPREELYLSRKFGERYEHYLQHVPRWLPKFSLWQNPSELNVKPYFVLRTMLDGASFFLGIIILEAIDTLRLLGVLPTYLTLL